MGKGKPRHNPNKPQNKYGSKCGYLEEFPQPDGTVILYCHFGGGNSPKNNIKNCKGNMHNCIKTFLHRQASKSDTRKINDNRRI